jgi:hypothetical protein
MKQMHNEKPNNSFSEKLDGMNSLPESFDFSANKVWDQLENQLQAKQRNPMILWLRYAAAIVLLAGPAIFWILQKEPIVPKEISAKINNTKVPVKIKEPTKTKQAKFIEKKSFDNTNSILVSTSLVSEPTDMVPSTIPIQTSPIKDLGHVEETITAAENSPVIATKATIKPTVVRKKYSVIHLYDLYSEPEPNYTKNAPKKQSTLEKDEPLIYTQEPNKTWWLPKPKQVIITSLTDNL